MAVPRLDRQDKLLYFRQTTATAGTTQEIFYPLKQLRGITTQLTGGGKSYLEFWFNSTRNIALDNGTVSDGADRIKIRFNERSVMYGAILYFWQDLYTSKDIVFKVIDAVADANYDSTSGEGNNIRYAAFGSTYNKFVWGHKTNASYNNATDALTVGGDGDTVIFYLQDD